MTLRANARSVKLGPLLNSALVRCGRRIMGYIEGVKTVMHIRMPREKERNLSFLSPRSLRVWFSKIAPARSSIAVTPRSEMWFFLTARKRAELEGLLFI